MRYLAAIPLVFVRRQFNVRGAIVTSDSQRRRFFNNASACSRCCFTSLPPNNETLTYIISPDRPKPPPVLCDLQRGLITLMGEVMEYVDPHHKRTEFSADSFSFDSEGEDASMRFVGSGQHESITLRKRGTDVVAIVPEKESEFALTKVQILESLQWLTLDFRENPLLTRIVIQTNRLNLEHLDSAMRALIATRLPFYHRPEKEEPIQSPQPTRAVARPERLS